MPSWCLKEVKEVGNLRPSVNKAPTTHSIRCDRLPIDSLTCPYLLSFLRVRWSGWAVARFLVRVSIDVSWQDPHWEGFSDILAQRSMVAPRANGPEPHAKVYWSRGSDNLDYRDRTIGHMALINSRIDEYLDERHMNWFVCTITKSQARMFSALVVPRGIPRRACSANCFELRSHFTPPITNSCCTRPPADSEHPRQGSAPVGMGQ